MLWNASSIKEYKIQATDGEVGVVKDLLFDDKSWTARWLVVDTGSWLFGRKVLLPVSALGKPDINLRHLTVQLTRQQVKDSPSVDTDLPVSRHIEAHVYNHYGWDPYWYGGLAPMGLGTTVFMPRQGFDAGPQYPNGTDPMADDGDPDLRSVDAITGYHIEATDGEVGHVEDFLFDADNWKIRYIMVDTKNWLPGKKVVISPFLIREIDWATRLIHLKVDVGKVNTSPAYDPTMTQDGNFDRRFHEHFWPTLAESDRTLNFGA
jgi:sporulation protein YlmC with PRC-barrel domain